MRSACNRINIFSRLVHVSLPRSCWSLCGCGGWRMSCRSERRSVIDEQRLFHTQQWPFSQRREEEEREETHERRTENKHWIRSKRMNVSHSTLISSIDNKKAQQRTWGMAVSKMIWFGSIWGSITWLGTKKKSEGVDEWAGGPRKEPRESIFSWK